MQTKNGYRMYYRTCSGLKPSGMSYCYAESNDGIVWTKPDNNIITNSHDGSAFTYNTDNGQFYMLVDRTYHENRKIDFCLRLFQSKDGISFTPVKNFDVPFWCDSQNQIMWDDYTKTYKFYLRSWYKSLNKKRNFNHSDNYCRAVSYLETSNLNVTIKPQSEPLYLNDKSNPPSLNRELPIVLDNFTNEDYDIYYGCVHQYLKDLYIAYPCLYYHYPDKENGGKINNDGNASIGFYVSENGINFKPITNKYMDFGRNNWLEYGIGHVKTSEYIIHYYIKFDGSHASLIRGNSVWAKIYYL